MYTHHRTRTKSCRLQHKYTHTTMAHIHMHVTYVLYNNTQVHVCSYGYHSPVIIFLHSCALYMIVHVHLLILQATRQSLYFDSVHVLTCFVHTHTLYTVTRTKLHTHIHTLVYTCTCTSTVMPVLALWIASRYVPLL